MAADAQMMSHFYSPLHMWGSSLHHRSYPPSDPGVPKYPQQYPAEQKYPPGDPSLDPRYPSETNASSLPTSHPVQEQKHHLPTSSSPSSSPHHHPAVHDTSYAPPPLLSSSHDPRYMTPPGHVSPQEMKHEAVSGEEKEIPDPHEAERGPEEKVESAYSTGHSNEYNGYYQQTDLGHPGYGGYSTAGPFPLSSPLARPRSSKAKSQSGNKYVPAPSLFLSRPPFSPDCPPLLPQH